jgi:DNA (cytosine-5)-methyltransferase 1
MIQQSLFPEEHTSKPSWFEKSLAALAVEETTGWPDNFGSAMLKWHESHKEKDIRVLSLFSGAGGLDIGFLDAGFTVVECNELVNDFSKTLSLNSTQGGRLNGSKVICMDINDYDPDVENIDFVIGGPPCQTFSAAGARAAGVNGIDDDRGNLFRQYVRILQKLKPKGFLFENVYRVVGAQGGKPWKLIQEAFQEAGYRLHWRILDVADFGGPQFRERLIIVGLKDGKFQFPCPTHGPDSRDRRPYYSAKQAIKDIVSKTNGTSIGGRHGYLLNDIPPGLNYSFYTDRMGHPTPHFGWRSKFSDYLYKADPETPVRTIKAQGGQYTGPFHWENRTFTIEELKRLQTFPDDYEINGNRQKIIHQLGNSVPPQLARILALSIFQQVFDQKLPFKIELLPESFQLGFRARKSKLTKVYAQKAKDAISNLTCRPEVSLNPASRKNNDYYVMKPDYVLKSATSTAWDFCFEHRVENGDININMWDTNQNSKKEYNFLIKQINRSMNGSAISSITMSSYSKDHSSITAIWKYLEFMIKKFFHKDDLVQLFGYYQYSNNYEIVLKIDDPKLKIEPFWKVLIEISRGSLVGSIRSMSEIADVYGVDELTLFSQLRNIKGLGYEIRNHNTNQQIETGHFLIPYSFPSLNERSLQRLTEL